MAQMKLFKPMANFVEAGFKKGKIKVTGSYKKKDDGIWVVKSVSEESLIVEREGIGKRVVTFMMKIAKAVLLFLFKKWRHIL